MISVLIADDHPLMREAMRACLEDEPDIKVVSEVVNGQAAVQEALTLRPDVLVIDLFLPDMDGIQALAKILKAWPGAHGLIFTSSTDEQKVVQAVQAGAQGYLIKDSPREEILLAIRQVGLGRSYFSTTATEKLASALRQAGGLSNRAFVQPLTQREEDVLALIGEGASNRDIAAKLSIEETTVRTHIFHILQKMGLNNRSELLMVLLQQKRKDGSSNSS